MMDKMRPKLGRAHSLEPIKEFVEQWQAAINSGNADLFNHQFAEDVLWGSPYGAVAVGYPQIHAIHERMFASIQAVPGSARYDIEHCRFVSDEVAIVYVRRLGQQQNQAENRAGPGSFDELAILVLVQREDRWWLAAAQHVPDRRDVYAEPGGIG